MIRRLEPPEGKDLPMRRFANRAIWAVVLAFVALAVTYSVVTPVFEAPDELFHYPFVKHLADGGSLPVLDAAAPGPWHQEGGQPPLYYALAALASRWAPSDDLPQLLQRNPHASVGFVRPDGNANIILHTAREAFPYHGAVLAIHLARLLSVALGALTILFTYHLGLEVLPRRPGLALAAAAVVASTPMFLFLAGAVNNDNLIITLATLSLWQMARLLRLPPTPARLGLLGVTTGLAALTKASGLALLPLAALVLFNSAWRRRDWRVVVWGGACIVGAAALVAGWWYYRNWRLYGDPTGLRVFLAIAGHREVAPSLPELLSEWPGFMVSYWGAFGWVNVIAPSWVYRLLNGLAYLGAAGLVAGVGRRIWRRDWPDGGTMLALSFIAIWPLAVMVSLVRYTLLIPASVGRLAFPAIAPISYLFVLGLASLLPRRALRHAGCITGATSGPSCATRHASCSVPHVLRFTFCSLPVALFAALAIWIPFGVIGPAYARPPLLTSAQQAAISNRLDLTVGDQMELLGYRLDRSEVRPGEDLELTLYWRAKAPMDKNYSVFIHLLDQNEATISQRDTYPGNGSFPTMLWQPGDAIADTYVIPVPANTFRPNRLQFEVGLYSLDGNKRLPVRDAQAREVGDGIRFGQVLVHAEARDGIANPADFNFGNKVALVGYDLDRVSLHPGDALHLTLAWKALEPISRGYTAFTRVLGPDGALWAGKVGSLAEGAAPGGSWQKGQVVPRIYDLTLPPDTPPGDYYVDAGLYPVGTGQNLNVLDRWGHALDQRAILTRIRVLPAPREVAEPQFEFPPIQYPLDITFGNAARLRGFSLDPETLNPHEFLQLTLYWEAINDKPIPVDYKVFVHLLDAQGRLLTQHDGAPAYGVWPVTVWTKGQAIVDSHDLSLHDATYTGEARFQVGVYDPQTLVRLRTEGEDDQAVLPVRVAVQP